MQYKPQVMIQSRESDHKSQIWAILQGVPGYNPEIGDRLILFHDEALKW